jgi:hypothetical protein
MRYLNKRTAITALRIITFVALIPISFRFADPLFTQPFHPGWQHPVLLVWPDHVEMRWFRDVSEISPRSESANYTFDVAPDRQAWVEKEVRSTPSPNNNADWVVHVKQLGPSRQEIQLELLGDGITGIVYEATPYKITPLRTRLTGAGGALPVFMINLALWAGVWLLVRFVQWQWKRRSTLRTVDVSR